MTTHLGKRDPSRLAKLRDIIGEAMLGQLVEAETLFYVLVDVTGLEADAASAMALKMFSGGYAVDSKELSNATEAEETYGLSPRQMPIFMKRFVKSTRVQVIDENPQQWQMNGFYTFEPPYISGYSRDSLTSLTEERTIVKKRIEKLNNKIRIMPDNLGELFAQRKENARRLEALDGRINGMLRGD